MSTKYLTLGGFLIYALFANSAYAVTLCVNPNNSKCEKTIQAAIDKAATGDVIKISPLPNAQAYDEQVTIMTEGITLAGSGCANTFVDGCGTTTCGLSPITVKAPKVSIQNLAIRHANSSIYLSSDADEAMISNNCFSGNTLDIRSEKDANKVTITKNQFNGSGNDRSISIIGDDTLISNNKLSDIDEGISIIGNRTQIISNIINTCNDDGISLVGHNTIVKQNKITGCAGGIDISGNDLTIENNTLAGLSDDGIKVHCCTDVDNCDHSSCEGGSIANNKVSYAFDDSSSLKIYGSQLHIVSNQLSFSGEDGIYFEGDNGLISKNTITNSSTENSNLAGIRVTGTNNSVSDNKVMNNGFFGILHLSGDSNTYSNNTIANNGMSGLFIVSGNNNVLDHNKTGNNSGEGIGNNGANTRFTDNTSKGNKSDMCIGINGTIAFFGKNSYITGEVDPTNPSSPPTFKPCRFIP